MTDQEAQDLACRLTNERLSRTPQADTATAVVDMLVSGKTPKEAVAEVAKARTAGVPLPGEQVASQQENAIQEQELHYRFLIAFLCNWNKIDPRGSTYIEASDRYLQTLSRRNFTEFRSLEIYRLEELRRSENVA